MMFALDLEDAAKRRCVHCAAGNPVKYRENTGEWVHDYVNQRLLPNGTIVPTAGAFAHTICHANELRKSGGK